MIDLDKLRKIDPEVENLSDDELNKIRESFYELGQLMFDDWCEKKHGSKSPVGLLTNNEKDNKVLI